ncbi:MAG: hypothetical protein ABGW98_06205 [Myxococcales bacterium]
MATRPRRVRFPSASAIYKTAAGAKTYSHQLADRYKTAAGAKTYSHQLADRYKTAAGAKTYSHQLAAL